jgi:uncharacterized protein YciI
MKSAKKSKRLFEEGRRLERAGRLPAAAVSYQRILDTEPGNRDVVARLLVVYRRLKDPARELAVVEAALKAVAQQDKTAQQAWIRSHPGAAKIGMSVLRKLGGQSASAFGTDPEVAKLLKRKALLERKAGGKRARKAAPAKVGPGATTALRDTVGPGTRKAIEAKKRREAAEKKRLAALQTRKETAEKKRQAAEQRKAAREAARAEVRRVKDEKAKPSLFVVSLHYLVPLERIDAMMQKHAAFLDKQFKAGNFLISGRKEPRTGGIIIARGKSLVAVERIMRQDPLLKGKLAIVDIVEVKVSRSAVTTLSS